eukprot:CAMPEP_0117441460 /NCGR_PEP_ID=MMETSP0759-20121206/3647_1 /TAXON_ID=63605 /ORGANISM="Percolomonas cosmopolitus, Strain WS" /LENGTH=454 /DNA_ID=CAMNT_0005233317 /DNA_START=270 /DNA_END=1634 /DNA_ORIENTATION=-
MAEYKVPKGYAPLLQSYEQFFVLHLFGRLHDAFSRPIESAPGRKIRIIKRKHNFGDFYDDIQKTLTNQTCDALNFASYNYLGFAEAPAHCKKEVYDALETFGVGSCSPTLEFGYSTIHRKLEQRIARFVDKDDALIFGMGFATNSTVIPALVGPGCLIMSDSLNHASIITGVRASGASISVFKHNDMKHLEQLIRFNISNGQPRTHRKWKKILVIFEGIYSMEGEMCPLPDMIRLKKKYNLYLYMDEAHSIGATGPTGRGVAEYYGTGTKDIDIMMGTFTKSFGSVGGYIAADQQIIDHLRSSAFGSCYATGMPPAAAQIAESALKVIMGEDGTNIGKEKIAQLRKNEELLRVGLQNLGFEVIGDPHSPVMCIMLYNPTKMASVARIAMKQGIAIVVVGAPATDLIEGRIRFCVSAAHTEMDIKYTLAFMDRLGDFCLLKYNLPRLQQLKRLIF